MQLSLTIWYCVLCNEIVTSFIHMLLIFLPVILIHPLLGMYLHKVHGQYLYLYLSISKIKQLDCTYEYFKSLVGLLRTFT
jgi:hypothetical protein